MRQVRKFLDIRRLDSTRAATMLGLLLKKKVRFKLSEEELQDLDFFDCLRLVNGHTSQKNQSALTIALRAPYVTTIQLRTGLQSSDMAVFKQVLGWEQYRAVFETYRTYFNTDATTIIDAGGNIGLTSLYFSAHFPTAAIVSIEPDMDNFNLLVANLHSQHVTCIQGAVWSRNCQLTVVNDFRDQRSWSRRVEETQIDTETSIPAYTIGHLMEQNKFNCIDILKMDVEGAEKEIFDNPNLDFLASTKCIAIEIHDEFDCRDSIYQSLTDHGFIHFNAGELTIGINQKFLL